MIDSSVVHRQLSPPTPRCRFGATNIKSPFTASIPSSSLLSLSLMIHHASRNRRVTESKLDAYDTPNEQTNWSPGKIQNTSQRDSDTEQTNWAEDAKQLELIHPLGCGCPRVFIIRYDEIGATHLSSSGTSTGRTMVWVWAKFLHYDTSTSTLS